MNFTSMTLQHFAAGLRGIIGLAIVALLVTRPAETIADPSSASPYVCSKWQQFTTHDGLPDNSIRTIRVVDGHVWVGTEGGLAMYDGRTWQSWAQSDGLPVPIVSAIDVDTNTGEVWLGTWGGGLVRYSAGRFETFDQFTSGLAGDLIFAVRFHDGKVWAATNGGVSIFDPTRDTWSLYAGQVANSPQVALTDLNVVGDDLYATGWSESPQRFSLIDQSWSTVENLAGLIDARGADRHVLQSTSAGGSLWLLTHDTLYSRTAGQPPDAYPIAGAGEAACFVRCLACPDESQAWIGTSNGLRVLVDRSNNSWLTYRRDQSEQRGSVALTRDGKPVATALVATAIPDNRIRCIAFEHHPKTPGAQTPARADGSPNVTAVWVGTVNGLARGTKFRRWADLDLGITPATRPTAAGSTSTTPPGRKGEYRTKTSTSKTTSVGLLGPRARTIPLPGEKAPSASAQKRPDLLAVQLALDEANADGRYPDEKPYGLVTGVGRYQRYGWGNPDDDFASFLHADHAYGMVGYLDAYGIVRNAVAWAAEIPFVNVARKPNRNQKDVPDNPWVFRCNGDEPSRHRLLIDHLLDQRNHTRLAVLRTPGSAAKMHLDWFADHARDRGKPLVADLPCGLDGDSIGSALKVLHAKRPEVVLTWCDSQTSVSILLAMRKMGMDQLVVGSPHIVNKEFIESTGKYAGQVMALSPGRPIPSAAALPDFAKQYTERNVVGNVAMPPSPGAYRSFHATDHLLEAIRIAGHDREAIRDVLQQMSESATGEAHYERMHDTVRPMIARLEEGRWIFQTIP